MEINPGLLRLQTEFGLKNPNWLSSMRSFKSATVYEARIYDFFEFQIELGDDFIQNLINYFEQHHEMLTENGERKHCAKSLRSWLSMFSKFYSMVYAKDLKKHAPLLEDNIGKWEKLETVTKAKAFTKEELSKF
jgi:hypothetical protein